MNNGLKIVINNGQLKFESKKCDIDKIQSTHSKKKTLKHKCQNPIKIVLIVMTSLLEEQF